ncbi:MAG: CBS domain-containing protein [Candidatus Bathyarchaeia archaeon]
MFKELRVKEIMGLDPVTIRSEESVGTALGKMKERGVSTLVILDQSSILGTVSYRDVLERDIDPNMKVDTVAVSVPSVSPDSNLVEAAFHLLHTTSKAIPVVGNGELKGVIARHDVVKLVSKTREADDTPLSEIMSHPVQTISLDDTIGRAREIMREKNIRRLPVVNGHGMLVGIITMKDIAHKLYRWEREKMTVGERAGEALPRLSLPVEGLMSRPTQHLELTATVRDAADLMIRYDVSGIPLMNRFGELVGMVTQRDILRYVSSFEEARLYPIEVIGIDEEPEHLQMTVLSKVNNLAEKLSKMAKKLHYLRVKIKTYQESGKRKKYSIRTSLRCSEDYYATKSSGWNPLKALNNCLNKVEKRFIEDRK